MSDPSTTDPLLVDLGPLADQRREGRTLRRLIADDLDDERRRTLERRSLVVLRRESIESGRCEDALAELGRLGCTIDAIRIMRMTPAMFDHLYRSRAVLFGDNWWLHHRIVDGHPVAFLLVSGDPDGHGSLSLRLNDAKGASTPAAADPASLRHRLGRPSSFHPMIHMAADSGAVLYESVAFEWHEVLSWLDGRLDPCRVELIVPALTVASTDFTTVHSLARRVAWCCAALLEATEPELGALARNVRVRLEDAADPGSFGAARARHAELALAARTDAFALVDGSRGVAAGSVGALPAAFAAGAIERSMASVELSTAILHLLGLVECAAWDAERLVERLGDHGLVLREDQRHWLLAGLRNDLNPNAVWGGVRQFPLDDTDSETDPAPFDS